MNRKSRISFGPGAASLILIVVILSMSILGILALMNARSDSRLSRQSIEVITAGYALGEASERSMADLDALVVRCAAKATDDEGFLDILRQNLPANMTLEEREITWVETDGFRTLECAAEVAPLGENPRLKWQKHRLTAVTEGLWN